MELSIGAHAPGVFKKCILAWACQKQARLEPRTLD